MDVPNHIQPIADDAVAAVAVGDGHQRVDTGEANQCQCVVGDDGNAIGVGKERRVKNVAVEIEGQLTFVNGVVPRCEGVWHECHVHGQQTVGAISGGEHDAFLGAIVGCDEVKVVGIESCTVPDQGEFVFAQDTVG